MYILLFVCLSASTVSSRPFSIIPFCNKRFCLYLTPFNKKDFFSLMCQSNATFFLFIFWNATFFFLFFSNATFSDFSDRTKFVSNNFTDNIAYISFSNLFRKYCSLILWFCVVFAFTSVSLILKLYSFLYKVLNMDWRL